MKHQLALGLASLVKLLSVALKTSHVHQKKILCMSKMTETHFSSFLFQNDQTAPPQKLTPTMV